MFGRSYALQASQSQAMMSAKYGITPLHEAAKQGQLYIIEGLGDIENIGLKDKNGLTPLHYAAIFCQKKAYVKLVELGADTGCLDNFGRTPESIYFDKIQNDTELSCDCCCILL